MAYVAPHFALGYVAEQNVSGNYTILYAPPELLCLDRTSSAAPPGAPHDVWALGVMLQQLLTATCQSNPWFLPESGGLADIADEEEKEKAVHSAVADQHAAWVSPFAVVAALTMPCGLLAKLCINLRCMSLCCKSFDQKLTALALAVPMLFMAQSCLWPNIKKLQRHLHVLMLLSCTFS